MREPGRNPDLTAFRDRGGKTIIWHGRADELITAESSIHYYKRVQVQMGGPKKIADSRSCIVRATHP